MIHFKLKDLMDDKGLTYRQVSAGAGVSTNTLYKMTTNQMNMVGVDVIDRLCVFLDIQPGDLIIRVPDESAADSAGAGGNDQ